MKCPHCDYMHGYQNVAAPDAEIDYQDVKGTHGSFYSLPIQLERGTDNFFLDKERVTLYACPACTKTFVS